MNVELEVSLPPEVPLHHLPAQQGGLGRHASPHKPRSVRHTLHQLEASVAIVRGRQRTRVRVCGVGPVDVGGNLHPAPTATPCMNLQFASPRLTIAAAVSRVCVRRAVRVCTRVRVRSLRRQAPSHPPLPLVPRDVDEAQEETPELVEFADAGVWVGRVQLRSSAYIGRHSKIRDHTHRGISRYLEVDDELEGLRGQRRDGFSALLRQAAAHHVVVPVPAQRALFGGIHLVDLQQHEFEQGVARVPLLAVLQVTRSSHLEGVSEAPLHGEGSLAGGQVREMELLETPPGLLLDRVCGVEGREDVVPLCLLHGRRNQGSALEGGAYLDRSR
mmetsp:Transcript_24424/g.33475  ORF Transcript_24424/g.33475 Transcript_24424/m.33475 type:complete len:330 (-) Transcript_24424:516-1505(-)